MDKITQEIFASKLGNILGIDSSYFGILSFTITENKRSGYTVVVIFKILGPSAATKSQELENLVNRQDPSLLAAGFENTSFTVYNAESTTGSSTTTTTGSQVVSKSMVLAPSIALFIVVLLSAL